MRLRNKFNRAINPCDKCGRDVERSNSAVVIDGIALGYTAEHVVVQNRHFLPVVEDGKMVCAGSPSRAQYIEGQPRDTRGYKYRPELEQRFRSAHAKVLAEAQEGRK